MAKNFLQFTVTYIVLNDMAETQVYFLLVVLTDRVFFHSINHLPNV